jgi:hypothetical protein
MLILRGESVKSFVIWTALASLMLSAAWATADDGIAGNTCRLSLSDDSAEPVLELDVTYLSLPVLEAMFESEEARAEIIAVAGGHPAFVVTATAGRRVEFYGTSLAFEQGDERLEPLRDDLLALEGAFGGRLEPGESTRGLVLLPSSFDATRSVTIEYASARQMFLFPSTTPISAPPRATSVRTDPLRELENRVYELEERLEALEEKLAEP